jgi:tRNA G18 (ribose-2'-O)-methylase SpoU
VTFTRKKFSLIGARARIKKLFHILVDLIPVFQNPTDLEDIATYVEYVISLNPEAKSFKFSEVELQQLSTFYGQLRESISADVQSKRQPFTADEKRRVAKILIELRYFLAEKIQQPIKESSFIILERDLPPAEPLIWPKDVVIILDHLRSPYNVGAVIRTMECVGLNRVLSIGYTPRLDSKQVQRSAMGCENVMNVEYADDGIAAIQRLKEQNFQLYILETIIPSTSVFELQPTLQHNGDIALVIGNEEMGVDESIIALADHVIQIPTFGTKNSLNVSIAFSITIYQFWSTIFGM